MKVLCALLARRLRRGSIRFGLCLVTLLLLKADLVVSQELQNGLGRPGVRQPRALADSPLNHDSYDGPVSEVNRTATRSWPRVLVYDNLVGSFNVRGHASFGRNRPQEGQGKSSESD